MVGEGELVAGYIKIALGQRGKRMWHGGGAFVALYRCFERDLPRAVQVDVAVLQANHGAAGIQGNRLFAADNNVALHCGNQEVLLGNGFDIVVLCLQFDLAFTGEDLDTGDRHEDAPGFLDGHDQAVTDGEVGIAFAGEMEVFAGCQLLRLGCCRRDPGGRGQRQYGCTVTSGM